MASRPPVTLPPVTDAVAAPLAGDAYVQPFAAWRVMLGEQDLTESMRPRLISLSLTERRGEEADQVEIVLHDADGAMTLPAPDAIINVAIGWARGTGVETGLVDKGQFRVDEVGWDGPPDSIRITARAADMTSGLRQRRTASWVAQTLGAIITSIAGRHGLSPRVHASLASIEVAAMQQEAKSDIAFIRDLGRRFDAVATVKDGNLLFAPIGTGTSVSGTPLSAMAITRAQASRYGWTRKKRDEHDGAEASWHDQGEARRRTVRVGGGENRRRLRRTYATEGDARAAAEAAVRRDRRNQAEMAITLALGDAAVAVERPASLSGFKAEIDAARWQVSEVRHEIGPRGFTTDIKLDLGEG